MILVSESRSSHYYRILQSGPLNPKVKTTVSAKGKKNGIMRSQVRAVRVHIELSYSYMPRRYQ